MLLTQSSHSSCRLWTSYTTGEVHVWQTQISGRSMNAAPLRESVLLTLCVPAEENIVSATDNVTCQRACNLTLYPECRSLISYWVMLANVVCMFLLHFLLCTGYITAFPPDSAELPQQLPTQHEAAALWVIILERRQMDDFHLLFSIIIILQMCLNLSGPRHVTDVLRLLAETGPVLVFVWTELPKCSSICSREVVNVSWTIMTHIYV